ncbi:SEC-C domain-containing protein [Clostridium sp. 'deep sea']|uniref:YecA family protein n=1 Tax=Clostridium sp. 'deep sea' TaxID=2779445 RepID=UPI0018966AF7|nr:SEC-C metal-binding domain-containing protein [Clostridium sp. 'deep sea']QOR36282.1 SEC-C domain-containing protein [Clostridium sp. 'deep sea']
MTKKIEVKTLQHDNLIIALKQQSVKELRKMAKVLRIPKRSYMNKIDLIISIILIWTERYLESLIEVEQTEILSLEELLEVSKTSESICEHSFNFWLDRGLILNIDSNYVIPIEMLDTFKEVLLDQVISDYFFAAVNLYGVIPLEKLAYIINTQNDCSLNREDLVNVYHQNPEEFVDLYIEDNHLFSAYVNDLYGDYKNLLKAQADKPYYIPEKEEFLQYTTSDYISNAKFLTELENFFKKNKLIRNEESLKELINDVKIISSTEGTLSEIMKYIDDYGVVFNSEKQFDKTVRMVVRVVNNSRICSNRGHTPNETRNLALNQTGAPFSGIKSKKIGRNEPCPCGSGKKYKKCCGR